MLQSRHPVTGINHRIFDASGTCVNEHLTPPPYYLTGLEVPWLKDRIKKDQTKVILVAGASPAYATGIRAVLKAGIINIPHYRSRYSRASDEI